MQVWTKINLKENNKDVSKISNSLVNYILKDNPITNIFYKYNITLKDKQEIEKNMANRIAGLLLLYFSKDTERINDIVNKYNDKSTREIMPELEGYVEKQ